MTHVGPGTEPVHHDVDPVPREARGIQGQRAGIVTRTAANTVDFAVVLCVLVAGYAGVVRHPLPALTRPTSARRSRRSASS